MLVDNAKAKGQTDVANKLAVVRAKKIYGNYSEFGKYLNDGGDVAYMGREQTRPATEFDKTDDTTRFITTENNATEKAIAEDANKTSLAITNSNNATEQAIADKTNATNLEIAKVKGSTNYDLDDVKKMLKDTTTPSQALIDAYNALSGDSTTYTVDNPPPITGQNVKDGVSELLNGDDEDESTDTIDSKLDTVYNDSSTTVKDFIRNKLIPYARENTLTESALQNYLLNNSKDYDLEVKDLKAICKAFGVDDKWVDDYKNSGLWFIPWGSGVKEK